jgi:hypothetical protein
VATEHPVVDGAGADDDLLPFAGIEAEDDAVAVSGCSLMMSMISSSFLFEGAGAIHAADRGREVREVVVAPRRVGARDPAARTA